MNRRRAAPWMALLAVIHAIAFAAPFVAPGDPDTQHRDFPFAPPSRIRLVDAQGGWHVRPFVYSWQRQADNPGAYIEDRSNPVPLRFLVHGSTYRLGGWSFSTHFIGSTTPAAAFLLGTDAYGRDQLSRLLHGARASLLAGLLAGLLALGLAAVAGTVAGYAGGWADRVLMFVADVLMVLPWAYLLLAVRSVLPLDLEPTSALLSIALVLGLVGWARPSRLVRAVVLSARQQAYVLAARATGAHPIHVLVRHVLPETAGVLLTQAALLVPRFVLAEVTLSFLGLGIGEPAASWGTMLAAAQQYDVLGSCWWMLLPGVALIPVCYGYYALADALHQTPRAES